MMSGSAMEILNNTKPGPRRIALLVWVLMVGCTSRTVADARIEWPPLGAACAWVNVDLSLLDPAREIASVRSLDPSRSGELPIAFYEEWSSANPESGELRPGIIMHHYETMTVAGHYFATGTYVYYLERDGVFYLWGDDMMGHFDGMVGPFSGDPRRMLPGATSPRVSPSAHYGNDGCGEE